MDYSRRMVLWMRLRVGDRCSGWFLDKAVDAVMSALMGTGRKREEIFRSLDTGL